MPNNVNVIIVTNCSTDSYDCELLVKAYSVYPKNLNREYFEHMVLQRGYELSEEAFKDFCDTALIPFGILIEPDFMYYEDKEQGYTEHQSTFHIDEQYVIWYEEGEMETIHYYGYTHECWMKPRREENS